VTLLGRWIRSNGPPKWLLTWMSFCAGALHLLFASLGVSRFEATLEAALYFYGSLIGIGTAGAVTLHTTGRKWQPGAVIASSSITPAGGQMP